MARELWREALGAGWGWRYEAHVFLAAFCERAAMHLGVITLFPELFETFAETSFVGRARASGALRLEFEWLREHGLGNHRSVDDTPYGGGSGMVLRVDCVMSAVEALESRMGGRAHRVLLTPQGQRFEQALAWSLVEHPRLILVCGRYEGFDERVRHFMDQELSLGDFVLTGGEVPAMAIIEATVRLIPGVLGNPESIREESFGEAEQPLLEYPHYTRPLEYVGLAVPEILRGGDHAKIAAWRKEQALARTALRRPDLLGSEVQTKPSEPAAKSSPGGSVKRGQRG